MEQTLTFLIYERKKLVGVVEDNPNLPKEAKLAPYIYGELCEYQAAMAGFKNEFNAYVFGQVVVAAVKNNTLSAEIVSLKTAGKTLVYATEGPSTSSGSASSSCMLTPNNGPGSQTHASTLEALTKIIKNMNEQNSRKHHVLRTLGLSQENMSTTLTSMSFGLNHILFNINKIFRNNIFIDISNTPTLVSQETTFLVTDTTALCDWLQDEVGRLSPVTFLYCV
jgi:hypothetical protein